MVTELRARLFGSQSRDARRETAREDKLLRGTREDARRECEERK